MNQGDHVNRACNDKIKRKAIGKYHWGNGSVEWRSMEKELASEKMSVMRRIGRTVKIRDPCGATSLGKVPMRGKGIGDIDK